VKKEIYFQETSASLRNLGPARAEQEEDSGQGAHGIAGVFDGANELCHLDIPF
jgi:hypothetical protein